ncbi:transposable element Tcb2 transposase [Trichonephila clavipes]|nr:transposable element Tcb2 transposase [Trichonephila clavipes]
MSRTVSAENRDLILFYFECSRFSPRLTVPEICIFERMVNVSDINQGIVERFGMRSRLRARSTCRVAGQVDRSECAVRNCWEQWTREGTHARKTGSGATRKTTRREDRRIMRRAVVDPTVTRSMIRADVGVAIVSPKNSRHLAEANLKSKCPFRALPLTPEHRKLCLQWWQARSMWDITDWQKVVFSDESWTLSKWSSRGKISQQDKARPHTASVAQDFLRHFQTIPCPARSPDLSPLEHVWDQLKRQMPSYHSVHDLELAVQDLWAHLPQDSIRCLINSMPNRVAASIAAGGGPTRY